MNNINNSTAIDFSTKILDREKIDIVMYHGSCSDGFGSAFVIWHFYKQMYDLDRANNIKYIPCYHQKNLKKFKPDFLKQFANKNVIMCDFSYGYDHLMQLISVANSFMILDHHPTARDNLKKIPSDLKIFDMKRSGAGITWDFFYPDDHLPRFLAYVQDRDIWAYELSETDEFVAYFYEEKFDFGTWETYLKDSVVDAAIETGRQWLVYKDILVNKVIKRASQVIQEINQKYYIVLYSNSPEFKSDIGNKLFVRMPFGDFSCVWDYNLDESKSHYSLRSTDDRSDVSLIAKNLGGGGHRNASGCEFDGIIGCLPYPIIPNNGIFNLLKSGVKDSINMFQTVQSYVLFKVDELNEKWTNCEYLDLIKRKYDDCVYIVFEKPSHTVDIDKETGEIVQPREYIMIYNEKSTSDAEKMLQFMVCASKEHVMTFTSMKEFSELFNDNNLRNDNPLNDNPLNESDSDSDCEPDDQVFFEFV